MNFWQNPVLNLLMLAAVLVQPVSAERIKDLADVAGVRDNQLVGYGLVVGLDGTGDQTTQTRFTIQSFKNMLARLGIQIPDNDDPTLKNVAAVMVHATLPPFSKPGQTIDVTVSSIANAKSLRGGTLLMTPLKGIDGHVYAMAQGNLVVGGFGAQGSDGSRITVNVPSVGLIPNGAIVERAVPMDFTGGDSITLNLRRPDFTTAQRLVRVINESLGSRTARALDATSVQVSAPLDPDQRVAFVSLLENLEVRPGEAPARVVVNSRTGTVVIGQHVRVYPAAITHGSLTVTIRENPQASQPNALAGGQTVVTPDSAVEITEESSKMFLFDPGVELGEIVQAVNDVGAAPGDLMAILEALKAAGALQAEFIVI